MSKGMLIRIIIASNITCNFRLVDSWMEQWSKSWCNEFLTRMWSSVVNLYGIKMIIKQLILKNRKRSRLVMFSNYSKQYHIIFNFFKIEKNLLKCIIHNWPSENAFVVPFKTSKVKAAMTSACFEIRIERSKAVTS